MKKTKISSIRLFQSSMLLFVILCGRLYTDQIFLSDGSDLKGLVVSEYDDRVLFSTFRGEVVIEKDRIDDIFFDEPQYNFVYLAHRHLRDESFEGSYRLFQRALDIDEDFTPAKNGLLMLEDESLKSKNAELVDSYKYEQQLGFYCEKKENDYVVVRSEDLDSELGELSTIIIGDIVSRIWGYPTKFMTHERFEHLLKGILGSPVRVTIHRTIKIPSLGSALEREKAGIGKVKKLISQEKALVEVDILPQGLTIIYVEVDDWRYGPILKAGDRIVGINGESTTYMPMKKVEPLLRDPSGYVTLDIERDFALTRLGTEN